MARRKNSFTWTVLLVLIMAIALLFSFPKISQPIAEAINVDPDMFNTVARTVFAVALGGFLISSGVAALAVPAVGIALIAIGLVLVGYAVWPWVFPDDGGAEG